MPTGRSLRRALIVLALLSPASPGRADTLFTPFLGANLNSSPAASLNEIVGDPSRTAFGVSIATMGGGVFGVEADLGYSPKFFGTDINIGNVPIELAHNNVLTGMFNLTLGIPIQSHGGVGIRPYGVAGVGLIHQHIEAIGGAIDVSTTDFGYDVGGGLMLFFGRHVGMRGDLRYIRTASDNPLSDLIALKQGSLNFTRASVGITFR
jgi:opacity protein-like surface antigen